MRATYTITEQSHKNVVDFFFFVRCRCHFQTLSFSSPLSSSQFSIFNFRFILFCGLHFDKNGAAASTFRWLFPSRLPFLQSFAFLFEIIRKIMKNKAAERTCFCVDETVFRLVTTPSQLCTDLKCVVHQREKKTEHYRVHTVRINSGCM